MWMEALRVRPVPAVHSHMSEWITDRQPTQADEDGDGEVVMRRFPDGRKSTAGYPDALVAAAHVGPGIPWKHAGTWRPRPEPEPTPEPLAEPELTPQTRKVPRGFLALYDMPKNNPGGPERVVVAIATDHTAWFRDLHDGLGFGWIQVPTLPDREEPIDAA